MIIWPVTAGLVLGIALVVAYLAVAHKTYDVKLFYYNIEQAQIIPPGPFSDQAAVLPVPRRIRSNDVIADTLRLLLKGEVTHEEARQGFTTEFPDPGFSLRAARLQGGVLTLYFVDKNNFTTGGSSRVLILAAQIEKTARQFEAVKKVVLLPEELFQP
ncbi:MAG: GerMN domain-containing protein [Endomicrobiales bacterium]